MIEFNYESSFERLQDHISNIKTMLEDAIIKNEVFGKNYNKKNVPYLNGLEAKTSLIRSQALIFQLHEFVKEEFSYYGIPQKNIYPPLKCRNPETRISGLFKQKDQDVCVVPSNILSNPELISWGVMKGSNIYSEYGQYKEERILATNVRSQLSSLEKNVDTLSERMFAEALNIHLKYPKLVLGELYMIPVYEYNNNVMIKNQVEFKTKQTNLEKYIRFFSFLNNYQRQNDAYKYDRAALIIVDFNQKEQPKIYTTTKELHDNNLISNNFDIELSNMSPINYVYDLLKIYDKTWSINTLN